MSLTVLLLLCSVVASISFTISTTAMFAWLRDLVHPIRKLEELIHCPWCLSHWVTMVILIFVKPYPFLEILFFDFCCTLFFITGISGLFHYVLLRAYEPIARAMMQREMQRQQQ